MDVVKTKKKSNPLLNSKYQIALAIFTSLVFLALWANQSVGSISVERNDILVEKVHKGDLEVSIEGYGSLKSDKQQLITTLTRATVKEIILKPGASVKADSVIVRLENPELQQLVDNAQQELAQTTANLRQLKLNNQRETLNESATLAQITASFETATLKRIAEEQLVKKGIVTKLTFQQTVLNEKQLEKRIEILKQRMAQLTLVHAEAVNIQQERIKQQQGQLNIAQARLDRLTVTAGFDGVLQRLSVELGQSLAAGQEIALIGSVTDLIALIRVPQSQAQQIEIGQRVIIDTRRDKIEGKVARIDPIVENNTVNIEVSLPQNLPASARPQLNVDGVVIAETLKQVTYIKRPANAKSSTQVSLYRLDENGKDAQLHKVKLGRQAGRFIEVTSGAKPNDEFIISDLSNLKTSSDTLTINY
ncbi:HlyD family efflux transporter periplasmic adaptor subunit [Pseudoalteromonas sp. C2R02]|uniref:efflux RND transporter periplasmic adaptor subunit n=1 Tax=Pseudoalteromonas sp. C2R02 TaxID=2841565 RepID=UPI001C08A490|nr:HlyD family efflux transporter periplasmic adaptor subunit [Pseudoalteromonas sp. C2R02]MBU2968083.1 HlyD family efflux transporter periplasmic adaptor subunit [Pseudoalteromonas sp. C2R02]